MPNTTTHMANTAELEAKRQDKPTTPMEWHLDIWLEEADEYGPADHKAMIAVAQELVRREEVN